MQIDVNKVRRIIFVLVMVAVFCGVFGVSHATTATPQDGTFTSKDIILTLFALLQTILLGIGVWLITNDKELFVRMANVEKKQELRDGICEERNAQGTEHHHKRASDTDVLLAIQELTKSIKNNMQITEKEE